MEPFFFLHCKTDAMRQCGIGIQVQTSPMLFYIPDAGGVFCSLKDDCQLADLKLGAVPDPAIHKLVNSRSKWVETPIHHPVTWES